MFKHRFLTSLILFPLIVCVIWFLSAYTFDVFLAVLFMLAAWEWAGLANIQSIVLRLFYVIVVVLGLGLVYWLPTLPTLWVGLLVWLWMMLAVWRFSKGFTPLGMAHAALRALVGIIILLACWLAMVELHERLLFGPAWLVYGLCIIFATDTGAYFVGKNIGRHGFATRVSPKKTWEGLMGGIVLAMLVAIAGSFFFSLTFWQRFEIWLLSFIVAIFAVIGDLVVSMVKRQAGVKDSGNIFPGHGGFLDRLDSIAAGIVIFTLGLVLIL